MSAGGGGYQGTALSYLAGRLPRGCCVPMLRAWWALVRERLRTHTAHTACLCVMWGAVQQGEGGGKVASNAAEQAAHVCACAGRCVQRPATHAHSRLHARLALPAEEGGGGWGERRSTSLIAVKRDPGAPVGGSSSSLTEPKISTRTARIPTLLHRAVLCCRPVGCQPGLVISAIRWPGADRPDEGPAPHHHRGAQDNPKGHVSARSLMPSGHMHA